ncbi:MAG: hypothetical protein P1V81_17525 [Planctomycetota bacterium]|nr:hypothetical protein [Planctomycetota bacterium]
MAPLPTRSLLLAAALLTCASISLAPGPQGQGPPASGLVDLPDSPDNDTGDPQYIAHNNTTGQRNMSFVTLEEDGADRAFNVKIFDSAHNTVGYYHVNPGTGNTVTVPRGGYVVLEDDHDSNDDDVAVGWWWAD